MNTTQSSATVTAQTLSGVEIFREVAMQDRAEVARRCHGHRYATGDEIISYRDASRDVFFIVSGSVRATIYTYAGKQVTFRDIEAGQIFGDLSAIDGAPRAATVVATADSFVASMSAEAFQWVLRRYPDVSWRVLVELVGLVRRLSERVLEFTTLGVNNRIHAELLRLAQPGAQADGTAVIDPSPTDEEIASRVSTRREAVNRELRRLEKMGLLARDSGRRIVRDLDQLRHMVQQVTGEVL